MKAADLFRGSHAVRRAKLPLAYAGGDGADLGATENDAPEVGLKVLNGRETAEILKRAREFAVSRGVQSPSEDDELYQYGKAVWTCMLGVVDPDAIKPEPVFAKLEELLEYLGRDEILLLAEMQEQWQQECSPLRKDFEEEGIAEAIDQLAGPAGGAFFLSLRPGLRWSLARSMAVLLRSSQPGKLGFGTLPESDWTTVSEPQETEPEVPILSRTPALIRIKRSRWRR